MILRSALQSPIQDAVNQTDTSLFQQCDCCATTFALAGDESLAGACSICNRQVCYMCNASLTWDEPAGKVTNMCEYCLMQKIKNK